MRRHRDRPDRIITTTLKGTRKIHAVRSILPGIIATTRSLSCVCESCLGDQNGCTNGQYIQPWKIQKLNIKFVPKAKENLNSIIPATQMDDNDCCTKEAEGAVNGEKSETSYMKSSDEQFEQSVNGNNSQFQSVAIILLFQVREHSVYTCGKN